MADKHRLQPITDWRGTPFRFLAFYLPQYHPIEENDAWWGPGFTEWRNVATARPLFAGHYQPHHPADLGYYDLRVKETRIAQASLAREYGIDGFIYYHYWFEGRRLLGRPLDELLSSGEPSFPFCLCWANEDWTRTWDGRGADVLIKQTYSADDDLEHIEWLLQVMADERYITVDGKPVLLVYRACDLPNAIETTQRFRHTAVARGFPGLYLCCVEAAPYGREDPAILGFDAAVEFQPDCLRLGKTKWTSPASRIARRLLHPFERRAAADFRSYRTIVRLAKKKPKVPYRRFPGIMPSWDNAARRQSGGSRTVVGAKPQLYQRWLESIVDSFTPFSTDENFIFVNAWNEWGEGNHLEPDLRYGRAYLEAHARAVSRSRRENVPRSGDNR